MRCTLLIIAVLVGAVPACTTIIVTPGATVDGSMYVTHSDDNELEDERLIFVPAMDNLQGSDRNVYAAGNALGAFPEYNCWSYPRLVCSDRGPGYDTPGYPVSIPLGTIPQIDHTFSYFDGVYGVMNQHQLMIGECTCDAKIQLPPDPDRRIFYSAELSRVALERCSTAVDAVHLIGNLIEDYGYWGTGETLLLGDPEEAWVMEMCCGTMDSTAGLWVARRVPDGEVFVAANEFRIRDIVPGDPDLLYSDNLFETCIARGWWSPEDGDLDWLAAVSNGEYRHPYYSLRRVWRVLSRVAPSLELSPWVENGFSRDYPFSVPPDTPLDTRDVMALHRDHYEGTPFDMTQGVAAGPFGYPYRYYGPYDASGIAGLQATPEGAWERPVSVDYSGYIHVDQGRSWLPDEVGGICWFGAHRPAETCFVPFYCGMNELPESYQTCNTGVYQEESAWWAFNMVAEWSAVKYSYIRRDIEAMQENIEERELRAVANLDTLTRDLPSAERTEMLTGWATANADSVVGAWKTFFPVLVARYDEGFFSAPGHTGQDMGYPRPWLLTTEWVDGPVSYAPPED